MDMHSRNRARSTRGSLLFFESIHKHWTRRQKPRGWSDWIRQWKQVLMPMCLSQAFPQKGRVTLAPASYSWNWGFDSTHLALTTSACKVIEGKRQNVLSHEVFKASNTEKDVNWHYDSSSGMAAVTPEDLKSTSQNTFSIPGVCSTR